MHFIYEKQTRNYMTFLIIISLLLIGFLMFCCRIQIGVTGEVLAEREAAAVSYLLEEEIAPSVIAGAVANRNVTEEGKLFLEKIGWTNQETVLLLPSVGKFSTHFLLVALGGGLLLAGILIGVSLLYFRKRERCYEEAVSVITRYGKNQFDARLPGNETGTLYELFGAVEKLALALKAKGESEHQAKEFLKDIISDISHQLKTPLAAMSMYTEIILEETENPEIVKEFSQKCLCSLTRMERIIQSLLKVVRLDAGSIVFEKKPCRIGILVAEAVEEFEERAKRENKKIVIEGAEETLICDMEWSREALGNLVKNALDHTDAGDTIRIVWKRSSAMVRLAIIDEGHGIAQEDIHHIFKRFYRSKSSSDIQGVGLGLPLAKAIIEGQGGMISVKSTPGEGTTFYISFLTEL